MNQFRVDFSLTLPNEARTQRDHLRRCDTARPWEGYDKQRRGLQVEEIRRALCFEGQIRVYLVPTPAH